MSEDGRANDTQVYLHVMPRYQGGHRRHAFQVSDDQPAVAPEPSLTCYDEAREQARAHKAGEPGRWTVGPLRSGWVVVQGGSTVLGGDGVGSACAVRVSARFTSKSPAGVALVPQAPSDSPGCLIQSRASTPGLGVAVVGRVPMRAPLGLHQPRTGAALREVSMMKCFQPTSEEIDRP